MNQNQEVNNNAWEKAESTVSLESFNGRVVGDRCQWTDKYGNKYAATVRWIGKLRGYVGIFAGLELDEPAGNGTGAFEDSVLWRIQLFHTRQDHAALVYTSTITDIIADFSHSMTEDFSNGLSIGPLPSSHSILRSIAVSDEHPWRSKNLYRNRDPPPDHSSLKPETKCTPLAYDDDKSLAKFAERVAERERFKIYRRWIDEHPLLAGYEKKVECHAWHETIRLCDVESFRRSTAEKARARVNYDLTGRLRADFTTLSITSFSDIRPVIYRYIDVIKNSFALLEAIHFELFMPDRPDLRFIALRFPSVPFGTVEGDYFRVANAELLSEPSFAVELRKTYPVVWEVKRVDKIEFESQNDMEGLAYIVKTEPQCGGETAISEMFEGDLFIRETLFPDQESRNEHSLVRFTMKKMFTAHLYPVEPPLPPPPPEKYRKISNATFEPRSEYLKLVYGVRPSSQRSGCVVSAVRELSASEAERIEDRLGKFMTFGEAGDLHLMDQLFRLGCRYRASSSNETKDILYGISEDGEEMMKIDEGVVLKTLLDPGIGSLKDCRSLLNCIYSRDRSASDIVWCSSKLVSVPFANGTTLRLNPAQSRAVRLYADASGPRVFCILAPPGSGKTLVAAAMAAEVARSVKAERRKREYSNRIEKYYHYDSVQLLLSVQNVAVDNVGAVLKEINYKGGEVYNMKSARKLNPHAPAPFDFFDIMPKKRLEKWRNNQVEMPADLLKDLYEKMKKMGLDKNLRDQMEMEKTITHYKYSRERKVSPKIILSTVEMVLLKMYTDCELNTHFERVRQIIIDEASLLTEAALFAIIRRFPEARIVLIGDDKQLPPFMYDDKILGQELAGRPALTVAMKTGRVPVVELNEVYRAPASLVAPYNRLSYGGRLVSKKAEGHRPLSDIGLIKSGMPQLLFIDVKGQEDRNTKNMSRFNTKELEAAVRLLKKFPHKRTKEIMIICLYKEQKWRLEELLDKEFNSARQYIVLTVDSAQGKEAPIVILLTTRTERARGYFCSTERCNVSVSRQQEALIILGNDWLVRLNAPWNAVVNGDDFTRIMAENI